MRAWAAVLDVTVGADPTGRAVHGKGAEGSGLQLVVELKGAVAENDHRSRIREWDNLMAMTTEPRGRAYPAVARFAFVTPK